MTQPMSELENYVRAKLRTLRLSVDDREDIIREITTHLELMAEDYANAGLDEEAARSRALSNLGNPRQLRSGIRRAKESGMKKRLWKVWVPALVVGFLAYESQMIILRFGGTPRTYTVNDAYYLYSWMWLFVVACTGALGAWWSRAKGGSVRERLFVAMAPWEMMLALIAVTLPLDLIVQGIVNHALPSAFTHPKVLGAAFFWMLHPAIASLLGALPFSFGGSRKDKEFSTPVVA